MTRNEMVLRYGFYAGVAERLLKDDSYSKKFWGRAQEMTADDYAEDTMEIAGRLIAGGHIKEDEDPWDTMIRERIREHKT